MPRLKLELPEKVFDLVIRIPVRITDINYGDHVGNDSIVSIIHESRMQFLKHHSYTELNIEGLGLIMADLQVEFKSESFYGDVIEVSIGIDDVTKAGFSFYYNLTAIRNNDTILIANARTGMVCYNYDLKKVSSLPEKFLAILSL